MSNRERESDGVGLRPVDDPASGGAVGVFSTREAPAGAVLLLLPGELLARPDRYSLQLDRELHVRGNGALWEELRHSCEANGFVDATPSLARVRARRGVRAGEEITIDYCATQETLLHHLPCSGGPARCYGEIRGYRFLSPEERGRIAAWATPWLQHAYASAG